MPLSTVMSGIGAATGGAGAIGSAAGGKKAANRANDLAKQQLGLQQQQFGLAKQQVGLGNTALAPASNYWNALLKGGQAAVQATGPYASLIGQAGQGARSSIAGSTARGGEQNLALANTYNQQFNDISRLYAGMQPLAAQGLSQLGGEYLGSGASFNPSANIGGAFGNYAGQQEMAGQGAQGFGGMLYNSLNKLQQSRGLSGGKGRNPTSAGV